MDRFGLCYLATNERLATFKKFPTIKNAPLCTPENFAKAGFYSACSRRDPDMVKCFACDKVLANWEAGDNPWEEHVKRGNDCPFVKLHRKTTVTLKDLLEFNLAVKFLCIKRATREFEDKINETLSK